MTEADKYKILLLARAKLEEKFANQLAYYDIDHLLVLDEIAHGLGRFDEALRKQHERVIAEDKRLQETEDLNPMNLGPSSSIQP